MPQQVEIPGQGVVEFPDGMDDAAITEASKRLSQPTPSGPPEAPPEAPSTVRNALEAAKNVAAGFVRGLPQMAMETVAPEASSIREIARTGRMVSDVASGTPINEATAKAFPESQVIKQAEATPPYSRERFEAGFGTLAQMLGLAAGGLGTFRVRPTLTEELRPETRQTEQPSPLVEQTNQGLRDIERTLQNATQEGPVTEGGQQQYQGVPPRENVPANAPQIREGAGGQTSGGGGVEPAPAESIVEAAFRTPSGEIVRTGGLPPTEPPVTPPTAPAPEPVVPNSPTGIRNSVVDQERAARGLPSAVSTARKGFGELWDKVTRKIDENPNYPDEVIDSLKTKPRAMTDEEDAALLHRQVDLQNQYEKANSAVIQAKESGDPAALAEASARSQSLSDQLLDIYEIGRKGGTETGRGLNARKMLANEDFSLANMITQKRAAKMGEQLTEQETKQVQDQFQKIRDKQIAYDAYETSPRAEAYMRQLRKRAEDYRQRIARGDFAPQTRSKLLLPQEGMRLQADLARAKAEFQRALAKDRARNRTPSQKFWDRFVGVERAMKLSSDVVLTKLTTAALVREAGLTPAEEIAGAGISRVLPGLARRAPREGGFSLPAEINAKTQMFTQGMKDAWENLKMKQTDLDELYKTGKLAKPEEFYDYLGYLHGALKAPIKRAEFARSLTKRMEWAVRNGQDINNQGVMRQLAEQAYVDANRSIFMQDNVVSKTFTGALRMAETSKVAPNLGPGLARIGRFLIPIVKVPTNIVGEVATGVHGVGTGGARAAAAYIKGVNSLEPAAADAIMRQLKKGLVGNALLLTGYYGATKIGGFYHPHDKRSAEDVQPMRYRIGNVDLPASMGHSTGAMLLNIGATMRRVSEEKTKGQPKGVGLGTLAAAKGLSHELPFIPAITGITDALDSGGGFQNYINQMITSTTTPALLSHAAKVIDTPGTFPQNILAEPTKRKPKTIAESLMMGIPGLRQRVPEKPEKSKQKVVNY